MLAPDTQFQERYRISYVADDQPECVLYRAYDQQTRKRVLIAELPQEDEAALRSTRSLAQEVVTLHVPGLLPVQQHFSDGLTYYMTVDDPGGQDLERYVHDQATLATLHNQAIGTGMLPEITRLLTVFEALHNRPQPLLVGDLHSSDVWTSPDGDLYLAPFALLRPIAAGQSPYRAPEVDDPTGEPTTASDIYALGAVCYHLLTGWTPTVAALRVAGTPLNAPRTLNGQIASLLDQVIQRALHLEPHNRYQTVQALQQALDLVQFLEGETGVVKVYPVPLPEDERYADSSAVESSPHGVDIPAEQPAPIVLVAAEPLDAPDQPQSAPAQINTCLIVALLILGLMAMTVCVIGVFLLFGPGRTFLGIPF